MNEKFQKNDRRCAPPRIFRRTPPPSLRVFCEQCSTEKEFVSLNDAVLFSGLSARKILRLVEAERVHYLESSGGQLFVCRNSLTQKQIYPEKKNEL